MFFSRAAQKMVLAVSGAVDRRTQAFLEKNVYRDMFPAGIRPLHLGLMYVYTQIGVFALLDGMLWTSSHIVPMENVHPMSATE